MINGFIILIAFLFVGDIISTFFELPIPGAIIGMIMLFITLILRKKVDPSIDLVSRGLISALGMLFVPASVGVVQYFDLIKQQWPIMLFAGISTMFLTLGLTAFLFLSLSKKEG